MSKRSRKKRARRNKKANHGRKAGQRKVRSAFPPTGSVLRAGRQPDRVDAAAREPDALEVASFNGEG
jgi:hypothetical protein